MPGLKVNPVSCVLLPQGEEEGGGEGGGREGGHLWVWEVAYYNKLVMSFVRLSLSLSLVSL